MTRAALLLLPWALLACDPDGFGRPATDPSGTDTITAPVVAIDPPAPGSGDDLVALIQVPSEIAIDGTVSYRTGWYRDGVEVASLAGLETVPADHSAVGEVWTLEVVASLGDLVSEVASDTVTIGNGAPVVAVTLEPSMPATLDDLEAVVTAEDPDGDELELAYAWYLDGAATDQVAVVLPAEVTARDEVWLVQVVATDPSGASAEAWAEVGIANSAPEVLGAVITPQPFSVSDSPTCEAIGYDDFDGDEPSCLYAWYAGGALIEDAQEATLDASGLARGDLVRCEITASDGDLAGNTVSSVEVEVGNAAPGTPEVNIFPAQPSAGSPIEVVVIGHAADPDGDAVRYSSAWTVDGAYWGEGSIVPGEQVAAGQLWEVTVTASDGEAEGEPATASVTISG
jgi:hypothetical protein